MAEVRVRIRAQATAHAITLIQMDLLVKNHQHPTKTKIKRRENTSQMKTILLYMKRHTNGVSVTRINMVTTSDPGASPQETLMVLTLQAPLHPATPQGPIPTTP